ncbi:sphingomyelin phosphodiesterase [Streptomyces rimosus]|uniref:sphingomyelin phosphodiesterase n=1 Tax=Streptomyces rimosus TaxID=1927 RepID=UPI0037B36649
MSGTAAPSSPLHNPGVRVKVATHNVMFLPKIVGDWGQAQRARLIPEAEYLRGADLVAFQELFTIDPSTDLLGRMGKKGFSYQTPIVGRSRDGWDATGGNFSSWTPENGGVAIVSKWPILRKEQFIYADACGADWYANKGFAYTVLNVNGRRVHFLATHTQSDDSSCSAGAPQQIRRKQLGQLDAFLLGRRIPEQEPVLVAGDFNIDRHNPDDYADLLRYGGLQAADQRLGWKFSFDTQDNSVARVRYPGDPRQDLDYVLLRKGHRQPADTWNNRVLKVSSPEWTAGGRAYTDYSDHYPLVAGSV